MGSNRFLDTRIYNLSQKLNIDDVVKQMKRNLEFIWDQVMLFLKLINFYYEILCTYLNTIIILLGKRNLSWNNNSRPKAYY